MGKQEVAIDVQEKGKYLDRVGIPRQKQIKYQSRWNFSHEAFILCLSVDRIFVGNIMQQHHKKHWRFIRQCDELPTFFCCDGNTH
jgi:hypothetical protein